MSEAKKVFDFDELSIKYYDETIKSIVPVYRDIFDGVHKLIEKYVGKSNQKFNLLSVGGGTGQELLPILEEFPNCHIICIDASESALDILKNKTYEKYSDRIICKKGYYLDTQEDCLEESFDIVFFSYVLHHYNVIDLNRFFIKILNQLKKDGIFIIVDLFRNKNRHLDNYYLEFETDYIKDSFEKLIDNPDFDDGKKNDLKILKEYWLNHYRDQTKESDKFNNTETYIDVLKSASFSNVELIYKNHYHSILHCSKSDYVTKDDTTIGEAISIFKRIENVFSERIPASSEWDIKFYQNPFSLSITDSKNSEILKKVFEDLRNYLFDEFGIVGGSFNLLEPVSKNTILLFNHKLRKHIYDESDDHIIKEIFDVRYNRFGKHKDIIGLSFFADRENVVPEYVKHTDRDDILYVNSDTIDKLLPEYERCLYLLITKYIRILNTKYTPIGENLESCMEFFKDNLSEIEKESLLSELGLIERFIKIKNTSNDKELITNIQDSLQEYDKRLKFDYGTISEQSTDEVFQTLINIKKVAQFPILSYSLIRRLAPEEFSQFPSFSHIAIKVWSTYSKETAYDFETIQRAAIHGLFTVYSETKFLTESKKNKLRLILKHFAEPIIDKEYYKVLRKNDLKAIKAQAVRAAISQVMARNSSHNIGSHVMNKLTGDLSFLALLDFSKINELNYQSTYEKDLQKLHSEIEKEINDDKDLISLTNEQREKVFKHKILLAQIALFNNYIKCRMDYLADITLGIPAMQISKRLKSDVLKSLDEVRLLLENISGLSGFKYSIDIKCDFDKDPAIAMPNDVLGCQAFYNIVENVIRNTAKHSDKQNIDDPNNSNAADKIVHFTVCVKKIDSKNSNSKLDNQSDLLYEVNIFDNIIVEGAAELDEDDKEEYYRETKISKDTNISKIDYLVYSQNKKLNDSILKKEDHTLRSTNLGLIELESSACYLRKMDIANLESDDYQIDFNDKIENSKGNLNILKAVAIKNKYLGYRFFVLKPTEVLLVGNYELSAELKINGFLQFSFEEFKKEIEKGTVFNHQFLVYNSEIQIDIEDSDFSKYKCSKGQDSFTFFKSLTPKRYFEFAGDSMNLNGKNGEDILNCLWEKWGELNIKWSKKKITNSLLSDEPKNDIIFLNHTYSGLSEDEKEKFNEYFNNDETYDYYIEPLSSKAQSKLPKPINKLKNGSIKDRNSVKESAFQQIVIIDERVQYAAYHNKDEGILFHKYYQKSNILVPTMDIDLAANDLASIKDKLNAYLEKEIDENSIGKERFLLIHYSILERLFKESTNKISDVNNWLNDYAKKTNVVVISGRGIPPELPDSVSYVSLSSVLASLIDFRSKYYFSNIIMSSRKSKKNE